MGNNITKHKIQYWNGNQWIHVASASNCGENKVKILATPSVGERRNKSEVWAKKGKGTQGFYLKITAYADFLPSALSVI